MSEHHSLSSSNLAAGSLLVLIAGGTAVGATQSSQTAPVLAFGAVVIAATVAALTSSANVRRQLRGEAERHEASLSHDRRLADIQHLRDLLDSAAAAYEEATVALEAVALELALPDDESDEAASLENAEGYVTKVATELHRLEMRFPPNHAVFGTYSEVRELLSKRFSSLRDIYLDNEVLESGTSKWKADIARGLNVEDAFSEFAKAARGEIGVHETAAAAYRA